MKKTWTYIILIFFEIALGLAYGLLLQSIVPTESYLIAAIGVPFIVLFLSWKNGRRAIEELAAALFLSLLLLAVSVGAFFCVNQLHGEFIDEYDVVVEYVNTRGGGYATFTTPNGKEGSADLHDYRLIVFNDDYVDIGDTIRVQEYKGIFNETYYVFLDEIH